jgi:serine/threonine protein kinase
LFEPIKIPKENFIRFKNEDIHKTYKFLEKLGEGSYGKVYKVENKRTGDIRAAKVMKRSSISQ